jgi:hypothetical protein
VNRNTVQNALQNAGLQNHAPAVLTNPGGTQPWLFTAQLTGNNPGAAPPIVLEVPNSGSLTFGAAGTSGSAQAPLLGDEVGTAMPLEETYFDGRSFVVRAVGKVQPNAFSKTFKLWLFVGNGLVSTAQGFEPSVTVGTVSVTLPSSVSAYSNWYIKAECIWDKDSLQLNGTFSGLVAGSAISATAFTVNNLSANVPLPFVIGCNLSSSANANPDLVFLTDFSCDAN